MDNEQQFATLVSPCYGDPKNRDVLSGGWIKRELFQKYNECVKAENKKLKKENNAQKRKILQLEKQLNCLKSKLEECKIQSEKSKNKEEKYVMENEAKTSQNKCNINNATLLNYKGLKEPNRNKSSVDIRCYRIDDKKTDVSDEASVFFELRTKCFN